MGIIFKYNSDSLSYHHTLDNLPDPASFPMHAHDRNEIFFFISGQGSYVVEGAQYPLVPGTVMIMRSGETHKLQIAPDVPYERISVHFSPSLLDSLEDNDILLEPFEERQLGTRNMYGSDRIDSDFIRDCFSLFERCADHANKRLSAITALLPVLSEINHAFRCSATVPGSISSDAAQSIIEYINKNLTHQLSLDTLSERFFLSKTQLSRIFRKATGSTVWDYIMVKRLLLARRLIRSGLGSADACRKCGFGDYSCFYRAYKKRYGISPSDDK